MNHFLENSVFTRNQHFYRNGIRFAQVKLTKLHLVRTIMNKLNDKENAVLLNLASHKLVAWTFLKLSVAYKYIGLFV